MISSETPYKLAEILTDTWPNLYRPPIDHKPFANMEMQNLHKMHICSTMHHK
jgi:hypothetical protein